MGHKTGMAGRRAAFKLTAKGKAATPADVAKMQQERAREALVSLLDKRHGKKKGRVITFKSDKPPPTQEPTP